MPMDNLVDFYMEIFDTHYVLLENIKFHDTTQFIKKFLPLIIWLITHLE